MPQRPTAVHQGVRHCAPERWALLPAPPAGDALWAGCEGGLVPSGTLSLTLSSRYDPLLVRACRASPLFSARAPQGNDALFGKFSALYDGEKYSKDYKQVREERLQSQKGYIQTVPFKPSNPMKESSGLGGNYGTLSKIASGPSGTEERELQKGDARDVPPNIVTNPGKKGTYGMNKLTIGQGAKGSIGEYTYSSDAYDLQEKQERVARATSHAQRVTEQPWRPANPQRKGGPGVPGCTIGGEYQYIPPRYAKPEPVEKGLLPFKVGL